MTIHVRVEAGAARVSGEVGVRVGMLLGRYLDDPALVGAVAEHVAASWLRWRRESSEPGTVQHWWDGYVDLIEAAAGGVDCADDDVLRRVWVDHARWLLATRMADRVSASISLAGPETVDGCR